MKLLFCRNCQDIFKLDFSVRACKCGDTSGMYTNELDAVYAGNNAVPLGILNNTLVSAIKNQPDTGLGTQFTAFVIPKECETFVKRDEI